MSSIPETETIQLNADGPLASEMTRLLQLAIQRARKGGVTRLLDGTTTVAIIGPQRVEVDLASVYTGPKRKPHAEFRAKLESLINEYRVENGSNTPDHVLAYYLIDCLTAWEHAIASRDDWYSVHLAPGDKYFLGEVHDE